MVGREYGSSSGYVGITGYSSGGVPIDDNRTPSDYNCVKYRGGSRKRRRSQRGGSSGNGGYGFVLDNKYTGKFYDSLVRGPCPQRGAAYPIYPPYINQAMMSYSVNNSSVSTPSAHFAVVAANPSYCGGRYSRKGRKGSRKGSRKGRKGSRRGSKKLSRRRERDW
jgi:hypothetical protein